MASLCKLSKKFCYLRDTICNTRGAADSVTTRRSSGRSTFIHLVALSASRVPTFEQKADNILHVYIAL